MGVQVLHVEGPVEEGIDGLAVAGAKMPPSVIAAAVSVASMIVLCAFDVDKLL